jgi:hypothetical protein
VSQCASCDALRMRNMRTCTRGALQLRIQSPRRSFRWKRSRENGSVRECACVAGCRRLAFLHGRIAIRAPHIDVADDDVVSAGP